MNNRDIHYMSRFQKEQLEKAKQEKYTAIAVGLAIMIIGWIMYYGPELRAIASSF